MQKNGCFRYYYDLSNQLFSTVGIRDKTYWINSFANEFIPVRAAKAAEFMIGTSTPTVAHDVRTGAIIVVKA
ncbi:MAG: hypothetical protein M0Q91_03765 [Methanoregula sp.]|jgi:cyclopropane fatty-acyl-phospholipid synthase-like methyltransferase|nr:hypothetical protein [Methanoregula sp.]